MIYTINSNCSIISITSDYLDANNQTVSLFWDKNCSGTVTKIPINVNAPVIQLSPIDLGQSGDVFNDGVYNFKISIVQQNGTKIEESLCKFINCNSSCLMMPTYKLKDHESLIKQLSFEALIASKYCTFCTCADVCALYTNTGLITIDNDDCGCN